MNVLNKPIDSFSYQDIVTFCDEKNVEGVQLDYKKELPSKGLAKHFASFSNTRGGLIIIGVEENAAGKPSVYEGIALDDKIVDKIHQYATNVDPRPSYDVHVTNEVKGKVFILVRILQGDRTPYYVQNDSNIHIRTGNVTDPISLASPEAVELLFGKKEKAKLARENYILRANEVYDASIKRAERERLKQIAIEKMQYQEKVEEANNQGLPLPAFSSTYSSEPLGTQVSMLTILLQPFFPTKSLLPPSEIKNRIGEVRFQGGYSNFPDHELKPIQDGILHFKTSRDGSIDCQQVYSSGLLYYSDDVLRNDQHGMRIYLESIGRNLYMFLRASGNLCRMMQYQGTLIGYIKLKDIGGAKIKRIVPNEYRGGLFWDTENETPTMNKYKWEIDIDTPTLNDPLALQNYFIDKIREMYWSLGYEDVSIDLLKAFLKDRDWLVAETVNN